MNKDDDCKTYCIVKKVDKIKKILVLLKIFNQA